MRIGHVRVGSDDFMQISIILRRRHPASSSSIPHPCDALVSFRSRRTVIRCQEDRRRANAPSRKTGSLYVRAGSA